MSNFIIYQIFVRHAVGNDTPRWQWLECTPEEYNAAPYAPHGEDMRTRRKLCIMPMHHITARTWSARDGNTEFVAELREVESGNIVFTVAGYGSGSAWEYTMRDAIGEKMAGIYPAPDGMNATRYFREVCNVPYDAREVKFKREL